MKRRRKIRQPLRFVLFGHSTICWSACVCVCGGGGEAAVRKQCMCYHLLSALTRKGPYT